MKKLFTLAALLCLALSANAQEAPRYKTPKKTADNNVLDVTKNLATSLEYETPAELKARVEADAKLKMMDQAAVDEKLKLYPAGGVLSIKTVRLTIGSADTKWITVIVQDENGKEILRKELDSRVASPNRYGNWENFAMVGVPTELKTGAKVFIADAILKVRYEYLIQN